VRKDIPCGEFLAKKMRPVKNGSAIALTAVVVEFLLLYLVLAFPIFSIGVKAAICVFSLFISGFIITKAMAFPGGYGLWIAGSQRGIKFVERISKIAPQFWEAMPMWGLVLGFGLVSYPLFRGRLSRKMYVFGIASIIIMQLFVLPYLSYSLQFLSVPGIPTAQAASASTAVTSSAAGAQGNYLQYIIFLGTVLFGFSGYIFIAIWLNAAFILFSLSSVVKSSVAAGSVQIGALSAQIPGVAPVIPGIDIPLVAGIISLAIILVAHEFSHGILAKRSGIKIKSIGIVAFGVIPIGAFVEPNERMLLAANVDRKTKIFAAGVSANFILTIVFLLLMLGSYTFWISGHLSTEVLINSTTAGFPAYNVVALNSQVISWNGHAVHNISDIENAASSDVPGSTVILDTNKGNYTLTAVPSATNASRGVIGVDLNEKSVPVGTGRIFGFLYLLYSIFSLSFLLNFAVAALNLLPIQLFDGWHIYNANIKNKKFIQAIMWILVIGILLNVLPLLARLL
jgi:membrane-associated protease RseP (regulator of RpoE activity)